MTTKLINDSSSEDDNMKIYQPSDEKVTKNKSKKNFDSEEEIEEKKPKKLKKPLRIEDSDNEEDM